MSSRLKKKRLRVRGRFCFLNLIVNCFRTFNSSAALIQKFFDAAHVTFLIFLRQIWQKNSDMGDKREDDFMAMLARCERTVFKVCLFYTDRQPDNVRDMYQDIVCNLWQAWPRFRGDSSENTWVYRIAINTAATQLRRRYRTLGIVRLTDEMVATLADCQQENLAESLYRLIDLLGKTDKSLILLYLDKIPYDQIAEIVGITETAARKRVERIKQKLIQLKTKDNGENI